MKSKLVIFTVFTILALALVACGEEEPTDLNMFVFAAPGHKDIPREVSDVFVEENPNVTVEIVEGSNATTFPQMLAAFQTTPDDPLFDLGYFNMTAHVDGELAGMWESLDEENIPNLALVPDQFRQEGDRGVIFATGYFGLVYNTECVGDDPPTSYSALWDPKYKGQVALWDYVWYPVVAAAMLNGGDEHNIDPGFELWAENTDQIHSLISSNQQLKDLMVAGEVCVAIFDLQQVRRWAEEEGAPVAGVVPDEGAIAWPLVINILKGVTPEEKKAAEELINELIDPETLSRYAEATFYAPTLTGVDLPDDIAGLPSFSEDVLLDSLFFDWVEIIQNQDEWSQRWDREIKSQLQE